MSTIALHKSRETLSIAPTPNIYDIYDIYFDLLTGVKHKKAYRNLLEESTGGIAAGALRPLASSQIAMGL